MHVMATTAQAMQGVQVGAHRLDVPGRHEADALTDCCPRLKCAHPVRPAAVLDEMKRGRCVGRIATYRCPACDFAWLCWWAPSSQAGAPR